MLESRPDAGLDIGVLRNGIPTERTTMAQDMGEFECVYSQCTASNFLLPSRMHRKCLSCRLYHSVELWTITCQSRLHQFCSDVALELYGA